MRLIKGGRYMDCQFDKRGHCMSIMLRIKYPIYKNIIDKAYSNRGGIEYQRDVLKASTAIRIRSRMIEDIKQGTILPAVVIGAVLDGGDFNALSKTSDDELVEWLLENSDNVSLIDGMQRTNAMRSAEEMNGDLSEYEIRVEIWFANSVNHLIYRMLILNTGQVPWDVKRQLETVFGVLLKKIRKDTPSVTIFSKEDLKRRAGPAQYQASDILELYLVFGSRKERIDIKERLSDEFVRLDFIDVTSSDESGDLFSEALSLMGDLDTAFSRLIKPAADIVNGRFTDGKDLFASQPARIGFIVSTALIMLGRPGGTQPKENLLQRWREKKDSVVLLIEKINNFTEEELLEFMALETLSEKLATKKTAKVGDYEREFFKASFQALYEEGNELSSLDICWNAY